MKFLVPLLVFGVVTARASDPLENDIDYTEPVRYLEIADSLGASARIGALATELADELPLKTIQNVLEWMDQNLTCDSSRAYSWRNFDDVIEERVYGSCADQAIFCGVLLKSSGIPVIWVKTMDVSWIRDFTSGRNPSTWSGHVFLDIFVNDRWMLLDPGAKTIYQKYSPRTRLLPGDRFAYHKGDDPKKMIMSLQWEQWKKQTEDYFSNFDESLLPVDPSQGISLATNQAFVVANSPYYQKLSEMARANGFVVTKSFNVEYETHLPAAQGHLLLVETHSGKPIVSKRILESFYPDAFDGLGKTDGKVRVRDTDIVFFDFDDETKRLTVKPNKSN